MNKQLYNQRAQEHLTHAKALFESGDYVQSAEKIWGSLSALINARSAIPVKLVSDKKRCFLTLFNVYNRTAPGLYIQMRTLSFTAGEEIFDVIYGLHKFFYGGANYTKNQLEKYLPFLIDLLGKL